MLLVIIKAIIKKKIITCSESLQLNHEVLGRRPSQYKRFCLKLHLFSKAMCAVFAISLITFRLVNFQKPTMAELEPRDPGECSSCLNISKDFSKLLQDNSELQVKPLRKRKEMKKEMFGVYSLGIELKGTVHSFNIRAKS